jgi:hypothetical protein
MAANQVVIYFDKPEDALLFTLASVKAEAASCFPSDGKAGLVMRLRCERNSFLQLRRELEDGEISSR